MTQTDRPWRVLFIDAEPIWRDTLPEGLGDLGHDVVTVSSIGPELVGAIEAHRPDFALTVGWGTLHGPDNLTRLRRILHGAGIPHVYWDVESVNNLERWVLPYIRRTRPDLVCTISSESIPAIESEGVPARFLTFGCNPRIHRPLPPRPELACQFALVATAWQNWRADRGDCLRQLLAPLLLGPFQVGIWGRMWRNLPPEAGFEVPPALLHGPVPHDRAAEVYGSALAVLGPQNEFHTGTQLTMRTFEILGSGAPLLTYRTPAVTRWFQPGRHLLASRSVAETEVLARWLVDHPDERRALAETGRQEVLARHTYRQRAAELIAHVQQSVTAFGGTPWPAGRRAAWYGHLDVAGAAPGNWLSLPQTITVATARLPAALHIDRAYLCLFGAYGTEAVRIECLGADGTVALLDAPDGVRGRWCEWEITQALADAHRAGRGELRLRILPTTPVRDTIAFRTRSWPAPTRIHPHVWVSGSVTGYGDARPHAGQ